MAIIPAQGQLLELAIAWWVVHMRRDPQFITAVGIDGNAVLHYVWDDGEVCDPYDLSLLDLHIWHLTGQRTTVRSFPI